MEYLQKLRDRLSSLSSNFKDAKEKDGVTEIYLHTEPNPTEWDQILAAVKECECPFPVDVVSYK